MSESSLLVFGVGILAQLLFGARQFVQWWSTEKARSIQSPTLFWVFSLAGSMTFLLYGVLRLDFAIVLGQFLNFYIYCRNLYFKGLWSSSPKILRGLLLSFPLGIMAFIYLIYPDMFFGVFDNDSIGSGMLAVGTLGYMLFTLRFLYQWYVTEKLKASQLPVGFFVLSIIGSLLIIWYGIYRGDVILIGAYFGGILVYVRNLVIHYRPR